MLSKPKFDNLDYRNTIDDIVDRVNNLNQYKMVRRGVFLESSNTLRSNYNLDESKNAFAVSPLQLEPGVSITKHEDSRIVVELQ